jgi:hypothetical protein
MLNVLAQKRDQFLSAGSVGHDKFGVAITQRNAAGYDHLARQIACLVQQVLYSRPVHGEQHRFRFLRRLSRGAARALPLASRASLLSFCSLRA